MCDRLARRPLSHLETTRPLSHPLEFSTVWQLGAISGMKKIDKNDRVEKPDCGTLQQMHFQHFQRNQASTPITHSYLVEKSRPVFLGLSQFGLELDL